MPELRGSPRPIRLGVSPSKRAAAASVAPAAASTVAGPSVDEFNSVVTAATSMFGDPTRRRIYLIARDSPGGITSAEAAEIGRAHV